MRTWPYIFIALLAALALSAARGAQIYAAQSQTAKKISKPPLARPESIFFNGVIYTGEGLSRDKPRTVQAMAVAGGIVLAVGSNDEIKRLAGPSTQMHDLRGGGHDIFIFPGFNDAHTHLGNAGMMKLNVDLADATSLDDMLARIASYAKNAGPERWLLGGQWDQTHWTNKVLPMRQELDKVTSGHPAFLERIDGHIAIVNSAALAAAGINGKTVAPAGGAIDLDASDEPTGILRESAMDLVEKVIPPRSHEERMRGAELAIADALMHGVTSVQDNSDWEDFLVYEELERAGKLNLRITEWLPFKAPLDELKRKRSHHDANDPMLRTGMLKGFMDGSLGSRTSAMKSPYSDDAGNTGLPQFTQAELNTMALERAKAGFQLGFHAIGDRAAEMALDSFAQTGISALARNRIEHAQVVDRADIVRFRKLGVIASMQPSHLLTDMNWAESRLGPERAAYSYPWKAFVDAGVQLAFGTDYPVEPITPFRGLYAAVTRMNEAGTKSYFPKQKITRGQALA
ncbi:MAG: amidohydrolase, partial [Terriglobia bacterium]|nr:amidohydrolase [Terriglobia bacterium]